MAGGVNAEQHEHIVQPARQAAQRAAGRPGNPGESTWAAM
jgi:hypothetical protein